MYFKDNTYMNKHVYYLTVGHRIKNEGNISHSDFYRLLDSKIIFPTKCI